MNRRLYVFLPVWMVGCQGTVGEGTTTAPPVASVAAAAAVTAAVTKTTPREGFRHHGGPVAAFFHAAKSVTLTASQRSTVTAVEAALDADEAAAHAAMTPPGVHGQPELQSRASFRSHAPMATGKDSSYCAPG